MESQLVGMVQKFFVGGRSKSRLVLSKPLGGFLRVLAARRQRRPAGQLSLSVDGAVPESLASRVFRLFGQSIKKLSTAESLAPRLHRTPLDVLHQKPPRLIELGTLPLLDHPQILELL